MFSMATVASSTRMPTASARPQGHQVDGLADRRQADVEASTKAESRCDDQRAAPRAQEQQDHQPGQPRGNHAFANDATDRCAHKDRLVRSRIDLQGLRYLRADPGSSRLTLSTICSVEALPILSTDISTACRPSSRTRLVCGLLPSCTLATSRTNTTVPLTSRMEYR